MAVDAITISDLQVISPVTRPFITALAETIVPVIKAFVSTVATSRTKKCPCLFPTSTIELKEMVSCSVTIISFCWDGCAGDVFFFLFKKPINLFSFCVLVRKMGDHSGGISNINPHGQFTSVVCDTQ